MAVAAAQLTSLYQAPVSPPDQPCRRRTVCAGNMSLPPMQQASRLNLLWLHCADTKYGNVYAVHSAERTKVSSARERVALPAKAKAPRSRAVA